MRSARWRQLLLVFVAAAIGLLSAWPYLSAPGLPRGTDAELHVFRTAELGFSLRAGGLYPRWAPNFYHGYGYPIFNYYAPLTYYVSYFLTLGRPELAAAGVRLCLVLVHLLGAVGAYLLGRLHGREGGGLLGAIAYSFAPYVLLFNPHVRGDLPESFALACLPWALWAWEQVWRSGGRRAAITAVTATAATFLSHNLTGLSCVVLVAGLGVWHWIFIGRRHLPAAVSVALVFVLLTAFFWLPFLWERSSIQLNVAGDGHYDFRNHFVPFRELIAPLQPIDRRSTAAAVPMSAGPQILLVACIGLASRWSSLRQDPRLGFYALGSCGLLWLVTRSSRWLWEIVPGMAFYQFPWRFLGPTAVLMVPLVSAVTDVAPVQVRRLLIPATAALLLIPALPGLYPLPWDNGFGDLSPADVIEAELEGRWRGTTSTNDFVPATVDMIPGPEPAVLASYRNPPVDRVNRATLPASATVEVLPDKPWINRFMVSSEEAFTLRLFLFDFPGWRAYVDDTEVPINIANPEGFITLRVPAGQHEVSVHFGATPARRVGWILSGIGTAALIALALLPGRRMAPHDTPTTPRVSLPRREAYALISIALVCICVVGAKVLWLDHSDLLQPVSPPGSVARAQVQQQADLAGEIRLLGYELQPQKVNPGGTLEVTLYWQAQQPLSATYQSFVHLVQPEGQIRAQSDHLNPGGFPTNHWPTDRYVRDRHRLYIPPQAAPGPYLLSVGLYSLTGNERLSVLEATCGLRTDAIVLCMPIIVRR